MTIQKNLSPDEQWNLDKRMIEASRQGDRETVQTLLASGANVHERNDIALWWTAHNGHAATAQALLTAGADVHAEGGRALCAAADNGHTEMVKALLAAGADVHVHDDWALRWAAYHSHTETVRVLAKHIFAPDSWRGKSRAEIEAQANAFYDRIKFLNTHPEDLRKTGAILADCALDCWFQVRPSPPNLTISPLPAQSRPL